MFSKNKLKSSFILALSLFISGETLAQSEAPVVMASPYLSASSLAKVAGLEIVDDLYVGNFEAVKQGLVPIANTMPTTYGKVATPSDVPVSLPLPRWKKPGSDNRVDFGADIFLAGVSTRPYYDDDNLFQALFRVGNGVWRSATSSLGLMSIVALSEDTRQQFKPILDNKKNERMRVGKITKTESPRGKLRWVSGGKGRRDY